MTPRRVRQRSMLLVSLAACILVLGWPRPAAAHPWGAPPEAVVTGEGERVVVDWRAEPDDALLIGVELGLVDPALLDWSWDGPQPLDDEALLPISGPLETYLLDRIRVIQDGVVCQGEVEPFTDLVVDGVTTVHTCPQRVTVVELEIGMLHDLHDAYRTFARSSGSAQPHQAVFTSGAPRHSWAFGDAAVQGDDAGAWFQMIAAGVLATFVAGLAAHRRRRRGRPGRRERGRPRLPARRRTRELVRTANHGVVPLGLLAAAEPQRFGWLEGELVKLIDLDHVGVVIGVVALMAAFGIGAAHALAPGHGKGLISAYLVGTRGRPGDALALGTIVAVMHCGSVLVLGGVLFTAVTLQGNVAQVMPWMSLAAGLLITAVGVGLVARQARARAFLPVPVGGGHHGHDHDHHEGHDHAHDLPEGVTPLSRRGVVALGVSGGLLPSPSAFLVLATAILMGRALFGLLLVAAFSLGLATTLTAFGLAAIKGRTIIERQAVTHPRLGRFTAVLPLLSSIAVLLGGFWITTMALLRF